MWSVKEVMERLSIHLMLTGESWSHDSHVTNMLGCYFVFLQVFTKLPEQLRKHYRYEYSVFVYVQAWLFTYVCVCTHHMLTCVDRWVDYA